MLRSDFLSILQERGFIHQCSNLAGLDAKLCEGPQTAYCGYDPTGPSLHVGHMVSMMMLYWFQQCGHRPLTLVGGATAMVGDPSFKDKTRPLLSSDEIDRNIASIRESFSSYIRYGTGPSDALMLNNAEWILPLRYVDFLREYGTCFTVNRMLSFDSVKLRLDREQPMTFLEFNYMIMQGYDFLHIHETYGAVLQLGGSDQWGNMVSGIDLAHKKKGVELFVLTVPLLATSSGQKMGKTEGGAVWLRADMTSPYDYWQYWRNTEDADVGRFLRLFTTLPVMEIAKLESLRDSEINEAKKILAFEATKILHGERAALLAAETARKTFEQGEAGEDLPVIEMSESLLRQGVSVVDLFRESGLVQSNGEAKRLIQGGGARINDVPVEDPARLVLFTDLGERGYVKLSSGRKKHVLLKVAG